MCFISGYFYFQLCCLECLNPKRNILVLHMQQVVKASQSRMDAPFFTFSDRLQQLGSKSFLGRIFGQFQVYLTSAARWQGVVSACAKDRLLPHDSKRRMKTSKALQWQPRCARNKLQEMLALQLVQFRYHSDQILNLPALHRVSMVADNRGEDCIFVPVFFISSADHLHHFRRLQARKCSRGNEISHATQKLLHEQLQPIVASMLCNTLDVMRDIV